MGALHGYIGYIGSDRGDLASELMGALGYPSRRRASLGKPKWTQSKLSIIVWVTLHGEYNKIILSSLLDGFIRYPMSYEINYITI